MTRGAKAPADLFMELASDTRCDILKTIEKQKTRSNEIAKKLYLTVQETHRNTARLADAGIITKDSDGFFLLTAFGKMIVQNMDSFYFFNKHKKFFQNHSLGNLPKKFILQISALNNCKLIKGAFVINEEMTDVSTGGDYLKVISAHTPPDSFRATNELAKKGRKAMVVYGKNTIMPDSVKKEMKTPTVRKLILDGIRQHKMIERVPIFLVVNNQKGLVVFPDLKNDIDLNFGFVGTDSEFLEWCHDYHQYVWEHANEFDISLLD